MVRSPPALVLAFMRIMEPLLLSAIQIHLLSHPMVITDITCQLWCFISPHYQAERLAGTWVFMWLALFASVLFYIPLYFWKEGRLSVDENTWYKFKFYKHKPHNFKQGAEYAHRRAAWGMLL